MEPAAEPPAPPPPPSPPVCRLCEADVPAGAARCPSCGLYQSRDIPKATLWRLTAGLVAVYAVVAVLVVLAR